MEKFNLPTAKYHQAVRALSAMFGGAMRAAKDDNAKQTAVLALLSACVFTKYRKLTDNEIVRVAREVVQVSLNVDVIPSSWVDVEMFMNALIVARDLTNNLPCCRRFGCCGKREVDAETESQPHALVSRV